MEGEVHVLERERQRNSAGNSPLAIRRSLAACQAGHERAAAQRIHHRLGLKALPAPRLELLHYHVGTRRPIPHDTVGIDIATTYSVVQVASLDATATALARCGTPLSDNDIMVLRDGGRTALVLGPDGHRFLVEEVTTAGGVLRPST
jgi:hypothetical protein